jgi:hypothetical protein
LKLQNKKKLEDEKKQNSNYIPLPRRLSRVQYHHHSQNEKEKPTGRRRRSSIAIARIFRDEGDDVDDEENEEEDEDMDDEWAELCNVSFDNENATSSSFPRYRRFSQIQHIDTERKSSVKMMKNYGKSDDEQVSVPLDALAIDSSISISPPVITRRHNLVPRRRSSVLISKLFEEEDDEDGSDVIEDP